MSNNEVTPEVTVCLQDGNLCAHPACVEYMNAQAKGLIGRHTAQRRAGRLLAALETLLKEVQRTIEELKQ